jgi:hypothetical protein
MTSLQHVQHAPSRLRVVVPAWAWVMLFVALGSLYLITQDNGAVLAHLGDGAHEFFHDARHSLGVPCH